MGNCLKYIAEMIKPSKIHRISGKKIRQIKLLAEGGYGYVVLTEEVETRKRYALKKIICQSLQQKQHYQHQVSILKQLSHCQHVIKYYGAHEINREDFTEAYILMELGDKTVFDLLVEQQKKNKKLSEPQILQIVKDIAKGLNQMHEAGITHQDVKVQNVIFVDGKAKLCDLGSSTRQKVNLAEVPKAKVYQYEEKFQKHTTLMYRPPEMIDVYLQYPVDQRVDTWMLGCVVFVMNYNFHPFQQQGKLSITNASIKYPKNASKKMQNFIREMLTPNPYFRPRMNKVLQILENWNKQELILNQVAKRIKQNEQYQEEGLFGKIAQNEWRNLKPPQQWEQFK